MLITKGIDSDCFAEMRGGRKFYELRLGDFPGRPGDFLALEEKGATGAYTGERLLAKVTYVHRFRLDELPWPRADIDRLGLALMSIEPAPLGSLEIGDVALKAWPQWYWRVWRGEKRHELRLGDRLYPPGTVLRLDEWWPGRREYSGRSVRVRVTQSRRWTIPALGRFWPLAEIEAKGLALLSVEPVEPTPA